jgi:tetratricopeptide (TPR) repeat protein
MRAVLADHPDIEWGWRELATWHYNRREYALAAQAADSLSHLLPFDPVPLGFAAELKLHEGERDAALKQFARAFELDPTYTFAGFSLFNLQIENGDVKNARQTLARLRDHVKEPAALEREITLEIAAGNRNSVLPLLKRMCVSPEDDFDAFERVAAQLTQHKLVKEALPIVTEGLEAKDPNDCAAWLWVELRLASGYIKNSETLLQLPARTELSRRALIRQLYTVGAKIGEAVWPWNPSLQEFNRLMAVHRDWFRSDDQLWAKVGYILVSRKRYSETIEWLQDWRKRKAVEPWMLENLLLALQETGRDEDVRVLIRDARALPRHLGSPLRFDLFHALREACAGNPDPGQHLLTVIDEKQLDTYNGSFVAFLRVALSFLTSDSEPESFDREKRKRLRKALAGTRPYRAGRETFKQVSALVAQRTGKRWVRLWSWVQLQFFLEGR